MFSHGLFFSGGEKLTLLGTNLGTDEGEVMLLDHDKSATIESWENEKIVVVLPPLPPGSYPLKVYIPDNGDAKTE